MTRGGRARAGRAAVWTLLLLGGVLMVLPFVYMLSTSLKQSAEVYELSLLPRSPTLANYRRLAGASGFPRWFLNSLVIATITTLSVLLFDSLVGYTLAKFRFRGRATADRQPAPGVWSPNRVTNACGAAIH
jgi:multiple sugar transport system permease protein